MLGAVDRERDMHLSSKHNVDWNNWKTWAQKMGRSFLPCSQWCMIIQKFCQRDTIKKKWDSQRDIAKIWKKTLQHVLFSHHWPSKNNFFCSPLLVETDQQDMAVRIGTDAEHPHRVSTLIRWQKYHWNVQMSKWHKKKYVKYEHRAYTESEKEKKSLLHAQQELGKFQWKIFIRKKAHTSERIKSKMF